MILEYLRERFPMSFFGPLALVLSACAVGAAARPAELAAAMLAALFLLAQFRMWDDVVDREKDAVAHPNRVLVLAANHRALLALGSMLLPVNLAIAAQRDPSLLSAGLLGLLYAVLSACYLFRRGRTVLSDQLLLAKYPAFVCILAGERLILSPLPVTVTAALVYVGASAYEAWHDPVSPLAQLIGGRS